MLEVDSEQREREDMEWEDKYQNQQKATAEKIAALRSCWEQCRMEEELRKSTKQHLYTFAHTCKQTNKHTYIHAYTHAYIHAYLFICV